MNRLTVPQVPVPGHSPGLGGFHCAFPAALRAHGRPSFQSKLNGSGPQVLRVILVLFLLLPGQEEPQPVQIHVESSLLQRGVLRAPGGSGKGKGIWPDGSHCRAGI